MTKKKLIFIIGTYIAIAVLICGYFKINPIIEKVTDSYGDTRIIRKTIYYRYSVLFSVVGLVALYSTLQLFTKDKEK